MTRRFAALLAALAIALFCGLSAASPGGAIALSPSGPITLAPSGGAYKGSFSIENHGTEPLTVSRVAVRTDTDDPRVPRKVTVDAGGATPFSLAPSATRTVVVQWTPDATPKQKQLFGHVVITSTDEARGEVAMGVVARMPTPLGSLTDHPLSLLVVLPLLFALGAIALEVSGRAARVRTATTAVAAACAAVALYVARSFDATVSRADGNDGLQFVEHTLLRSGWSAEYFVGVDGRNVAAVVITSLVYLAACLATTSPARHAAAHDALLSACFAFGVGALVAQDAGLLVAFTLALAFTICLFLAAFGRSRVSLAFAALFLLGGAACLALGVSALHSASDPSLLVTGERTSLSYSLPDLARVSFLAKHSVALGHPLVETAWVLGFVFSLAFAAAFPLHFWLPRVTSSLGTAAGAVIVATTTSVGLTSLVALATVLPEATRWAAPTMVTLGLLGALASSLRALAERDWSRLAAHAITAQSSLFVAALGALTAQGVAALLVGVPTLAASAALFVLSTGVLASRLGSRDAARVEGLAREAPALAGTLAVGALGIMAAPGTCASWAAWSSITSLAPRGTGAAIGGAAALAILAVAVGRRTLGALAGHLPLEWRDSARLEPHGGHLPDLDTKATLALVGLAAVVLVLGAHPTPLFAAAASVVRELGGALNPLGPGEIT